MKLLRLTIYIAAIIFCGSFFVSSAHAADVFYSVGQSTADLKTGTPTVTITSGAAVFSAAQTGNIGVGDRVTYNTSSIAYIAAKTNADKMHWNLITATGGIPADITDSTVVSITHEYTTLNSAVAGASDANHINNTDLTAANVVLNIPCYYDSGADTTAVTVTGYTTGALNYIKIYTPNNTTTEANNSQRHQGKWDDEKYTLYNSITYASTLDNRVGYTVVDGLQMYSNITYKNVVSFIEDHTTGTYSTVKNSIIKSNNNVDVYGIWTLAWSNSFYIYNNIFIDVYRAINRQDGNAYIYNNTVINSAQIGIYSSSNRIGMAKNNIVQGSGTNYSGTFNASSASNISQDATSPNAAFQNKTVSFADAANKDFHLSNTDTAARSAGVNLQADPYLHFSQDIDGQERTGLWDIGADQFADGHVGSTEIPGSKTTINASQNDKYTNGLVGLWSFDGPDVSGTTAYDRSGNNNNGTISGATVTPGKIGQAMSFDGNDYVPTTLSQSFPFSISAWVLYRGQGSAGFWSKIITTSIGAATNYGLQTYSTSDDLYFGWGTSDGYFMAYSGPNLVTGEWTHVGLTWDGVPNRNNLKAFINGAEVPFTGGNNRDGATVNLPPANWAIGAATSNNYHINANIDDVRIYNRVLNADEITGLYNMGKVRLRK